MLDDEPIMEDVRKRPASSMLTRDVRDDAVPGKRGSVRNASPTGTSASPFARRCRCARGRGVPNGPALSRDRVIAYIAREHGRGRPLADILHDRFVVEHATEIDAGLLLEKPSPDPAAGGRLRDVGVAGRGAGPAGCVIERSRGRRLKRT